MKKIKITLVKSPIDRPERQKLTLQALGLNKMNASQRSGSNTTDPRYGPQGGAYDFCGGSIMLMLII
jgi:ribosomal protein L30